ncbi:MAG: T9SS type A sorting domain-containing protein, partial [Flavobacteriaceae bacterium]|nr:T9SS type A sorting domain-containing protein [Flavobacteriaceae bacterium]
VSDTEAPVVICPPSQSVDHGGPRKKKKIPDYFGIGTASANDNCTNPLTIFTQNPAPGTMLSDGVYTITLTAEDASANVGNCNFQLTVDSTLGINDVSFSNGITLIPNPVNHTFSLVNKSHLPIDEVVIYDLHGRILDRFDFKGARQMEPIDVSLLSSGLYILYIQAENASAVKQLIKK